MASQLLVGFAILGQASLAENWDGSPLVLARHQSVTMAQTPNGSLVLAWLNVATMNNLGQLAISSGGGTPQFEAAPALVYQPSVLIENWGANNLTVTNTSAADATPIRIQAIGPGIPGVDAVPLQNDGTELVLAPGKNAQGQTLARWMQLSIANSSGELSVIAVVGGPAGSSGNNACLVAVNAQQNTGTGSGSQAAPPPGYCATVTGNTYAWSFNAGAVSVFVSNLSALTGAATTISLFQL